MYTNQNDQLNTNDSIIVGIPYNANNQNQVVQNNQYTLPTNYINHPTNNVGNNNIQDQMLIHNQLENNDNLNSDLFNLKQVLTSKPVFIVCPYCKEPTMTAARQKCNCGNLCCCICFGLGGWIVFQALRKKDINCMDASHECLKCGKKVGDYTSC
jgi:hypothetical protein